MARTLHDIVVESSLGREIERLRAQAKLGWPKERDALVAAGLGDAARVIEVGCGSGALAALILADFPTVRYTGVDRARVLVSTIAASSRMTRVCGSATSLPIQTATHDIAVARLLFQHLSQPVDAARELWRVLVPRGVAVVIDTDDDLGTTFDPPIPALSPVALKVKLAQLFHGGNRHVGTRLPHILCDAGFSDVGFDVIALESDEIGLDGFRELHRIDALASLVETGLLTPREYERARRGLDEFFASPNPRIVDRRCVAWGTKPDG